MATLVALSWNGRFVASRSGGAVEVRDLLGVAPQRTVAVDGDEPFAFVGAGLWLARAGALRRMRLDTGTIEVSRLAVAGGVRAIRPAGARDATAALVVADDLAWVEPDSQQPVAHDAFPLHGRRLVTVTNGELALLTLGRAGVLRLGIDGELRGATSLWGGRAAAVWTTDRTGDAIVVVTSAGQRVHRIAVPALAACAFAGDAGIAVASVGDEVWSIDLRYGRVRATATAALRIDELAIDADGRRIAIGRRDGSATTAMLATQAELFTAGATSEVGSEDTAPDASEREALPTVAAPAPVTTPTPIAIDVIDTTDDALPELQPLAFAPATVPAAIAHAPIADVAFASPHDHLTALLELVIARTALAIAEGWHSGRISHDVEGGLPYEHEVLGLIGEGMGLAGEALRRARGRLGVRAEAVATRALASLAAGMTLPFVELARELALSPIATQVLLCVAAPQLRGEIARLYGVLAGAAGRACCDAYLVETLLAEDAATRDRVARELAPDAVLVRAGLVCLVHDVGGRVVLTIDDVLADRLRGHNRAVDITAVAIRRTSDVDLADVVAPIGVKRALVLGLADRDEARPARVVIRGRRGAGRHTLIAALAARVDRTIATIDVERLPRTGAAFATALRLELTRAAIARAIPVVSGLEGLDPTDSETRHLAREVIRAHPGPLVVRAAPEGELPIVPDHLLAVLPPLGLGERAAVWARALARHGLGIDDRLDPDALASRFRFGPGTIERVCVEVARRATRTHGPGHVPRLIDQVARQQVAVRLGRVATRVERLPDWDQVTLPDDMKDSVRELVGRARWKRQVFEDWGMGRRITSARGLTALFYGPPGTGKTLVAGLVARELNLELWRVDLARVMSKWVGETEKNLGEIFDAAEEGQIMLLFDEADSLFAKRTEVKSSNDRYANLEVNYLLQRLDSFEGVAVLTTNLEGSVDDAFKRRLSMRLYFPFPDEELRAELWAAHVPAEMPVAGVLDFVELARRFRLSGGYIRNSALRAAFLAAQEQRPLTHEHLVRAVQLEYRELGKLATGGVMS